jgi:NAD(P)-dependent dehydrogenase (short-subunit alcohol dehydrogenase family)
MAPQGLRRRHMPALDGKRRQPYAIAPMGRLSGRVVLVTGATSGIGHAIARRCAGEGASVLATGRDQQRLAEVASTSESIAGYAADLADRGAADECVAEAVSRFGRLDGLVHAAGIVRRQEDIRHTTDEQWADMLAVSLDASFRLARASLRVMAANGAGSIVLISSQLAHVAAPGYASYCAAKGGVEALVRALAVDFGPSGVRVNALAPGVVASPMAYVDRPDFDDQVTTIAARLPLRRVGQPEDMAGPAVFLLSDDSAWMTGQSLVVDGGFTIQ